MSTVSKAGIKIKKTVIEKKTSGKKTAVKKNIEKTVSKTNKKKNNLLKLCSVMGKFADDANDKEIIKRFKTTISSSIEEDISKNNLSLILNKTEDVKVSDFSESLQPYIKHYLFMFNRSKNRKK